MKKNKSTNIVAGLLMISFIGIFLVLSGRFLYIQVSGEVNNVSLEQWAKQKRTSSYSLHAERGKILDNNGMALAYDQPTYRLYAIVDEAFSENQKTPQHVEDPEKTAEKLSDILDVEKEDILTTLNAGIKNGRTQVEFGKQGKGLSQQQKDDITAMKLPGINFNKEAMRYYPNGMFASRIIGFARETEEEDENGQVTREIKGVTGIEDEKNDFLKGEDGYISYERDKYNKKLLDPNEVIKKPKNGNDVYLTIDQKVQTLLEDVMSQVQEQYTPERMTAIVMDAKTGEIIAMGNRPSYNPNNPEDVKNWYNDAISTPFEPGSTMKMFTWASAIEEGVYNGDEEYKSGSYRINEQVQPVNDHNGGEGWGTISYDEGFIRSSNVAAAKLLWEKMDSDTYLDYLHSFDFDKKTDIDLPGESEGKISYTYPRDKLSTTFGQGTTLTPIQQVKAASAIANNGKMLQPYVIKRIVDANTGDVIKEKQPKVVGEPISKETSHQVLDLLESVVSDKDGTGKMFALDNYSVVGKTGTSQIPNPDGGYLRGVGNNIFSFLGMAPHDDPELIMYVAVKQPDLETEDGFEQGSAPVSFIFKNVMESSLRYLNIEPDKEAKNETKEIKMTHLKEKNAKKVKKDLENQGVNVSVIGSGEKVTASNVHEGEEILPNDRVILITDKVKMPNVIGWSSRDIMQLANLLDLEITIEGNGFVESQSIAADKPIKKGDSLTVELSSPTKVEPKDKDPD